MKVFDRLARASSFTHAGHTESLAEEGRVPVGGVVPESVPEIGETRRAERGPAPVAKKAAPVSPFVATWSAGVPSAQESAWKPGTGGVNTPARRSEFVDELVGNIDKL